MTPREAWEAFWLWIDEKRVIRRAVLFLMLYWTGTTLAWSIHFAETSLRPGVDVAAILAAIWGPMGLLQGAVFAFYSKARSAEETQ